MFYYRNALTFRKKGIVNGSGSNAIVTNGIDLLYILCKWIVNLLQSIEIPEESGYQELIQSLLMEKACYIY